MTAELHALVVESRQRQGLPPTIEDPATLSLLAAILLEQVEEGEAA